MNKEPINYEAQSIEARMGYRPLSKTWSKIEILLGLGVVWCALQPKFIPEFIPDPELAMLVSLGLFILGGYLAMAGSRSHLYQSANKQTAFLLQQILDRKQ